MSSFLGLRTPPSQSAGATDKRRVGVRVAGREAGGAGGQRAERGEGGGFAEGAWAIGGRVRSGKEPAVVCALGWGGSPEV